MDKSLIELLKEAAAILDANNVPTEGRTVWMSNYTFKMFTDKRYRGRMIRRGKTTKKEARFYARIP